MNNILADIRRANYIYMIFKRRLKTHLSTVAINTEIVVTPAYG